MAIDWADMAGMPSFLKLRSMGEGVQKLFGRAPGATGTGMGQGAAGSKTGVPSMKGPPDAAGALSKPTSPGPKPRMGAASTGRGSTRDQGMSRIQAQGGRGVSSESVDNKQFKFQPGSLDAGGRPTPAGYARQTAWFGGAGREGIPGSGPHRASNLDYTEWYNSVYTPMVEDGFPPDAIPGPNDPRTKQLLEVGGYIPGAGSLTSQLKSASAFLADSDDPVLSLQSLIDDLAASIEAGFASDTAGDTAQAAAQPVYAGGVAVNPMYFQASGIV